MKVMLYQEYMDFMMSAKEGIILIYGNNFAQCLIIFQFQLLLMSVYYACMGDFLNIWIISLKSIQLLNH